MISEGVRPPTGQPSGSSSPLCASRTSFIKWQLGVYLTPLPNFLSGVTCSKTYLPDKYVVIFSALMNIYPLFFMHWPIISRPKQLRPNMSHTSEILLFGKVSMIHPLHIVWYSWGQQGSRAASWAHLHFHSKVENGHSWVTPRLVKSPRFIQVYSCHQVTLICNSNIQEEGWKVKGTNKGLWTCNHTLQKTLLSKTFSYSLKKK